MGGKPYGVWDEVTNKRLKHRKDISSRPVRPKVMKIGIRCSLLVRNGANQISISQLTPRKNAKHNSISQVTSPKSRPKKRCRKHDQKPMPVFISLKAESVLLSVR